MRRERERRIYNEENNITPFDIFVQSFLRPRDCTDPLYPPNLVTKDPKEWFSELTTVLHRSTRPGREPSFEDEKFREKYFYHPDEPCEVKAQLGTKLHGRNLCRTPELQPVATPATDSRATDSEDRSLAPAELTDQLAASLASGRPNKAVPTPPTELADRLAAFFAAIKLRPVVPAPSEANMVNDSFLESETQAAKLEELKGFTIAVEASWYIHNLLNTPPAKEPLLSALGGLPFWLKSEIEDDLDQWKKAGMTPLFIFDGLSIIGKEEMSLRAAKEAARRNDEAWALYCKAVTKDQTTEAVTAFGNSGAIQARSLYRFLQEILYERDLTYEIATHSACAYMAYLDKNPTRPDGTQVFEAIMGSLELLLYEIDQSVITKMDFGQMIYWAVAKPTLLKKLNVSEETFINALLMAGTSFLPTFPVLKDREIIKLQPFTMTDAINMYRTASKSMVTLCDTWTEIVQKQEPKWDDKYRKARMAIKHNIHVSVGLNPGEGAKIVVSNSDALTGDHHEYIGLSLPDELYHYLIHGCIGPRVMNWLSYLEMLVFPPLDGGDSEEYRRLVTKQLVPIQAQTIALCTSRMHRAFQHKAFTIRFWFDNTTTVAMNHQNVDPAPDAVVACWRVTQSVYEKQVAITRTKPGSFSFALMALQDKDFVIAFHRNVPEVQSLKSQSEILSNTMWRLLHLRGYFSNNHGHELTVWGKALLATLKALNSIYPLKESGAFNPTLHRLEEAAFLAFELLQLDQLNARNRHDEWIGSPRRGSEQDKTHCLLIARCACLIKLRHKEIGYTGPLSKNLLAYHSIISAVRETDRDLVEAIVASMFMFAHADRRSARDENSATVRKRHNSDWTELGFSLPFGNDVDIGLGIAVKTYLDEYCLLGATSQDKDVAKSNYVLSQLPESEDFPGDLEIAFNFFEALALGVEVLGKSLGNEISDADRRVWRAAGKYLKERR